VRAPSRPKSLGNVPTPGRRRLRTAVIVPAGPSDDVFDTVHSVVRYTDPSRVILVIDDRGELRAEQSVARLRELSPDIAVIPAPAARAGRCGGLWVKLSAGYRWTLDNFDPDLVMRLDADAVMLGPGLEDLAERSFASDQGLGLLGSYRVGTDGGLRDFSWVARQLRAETGSRGLAHSKMRALLRHYHRLARSNGYEDGEHVLGGAYIHRGAVITAIAGNGWLDQARGVERTRLGDDHLISLLTVAAGYRMADFGGPDGPMALAWQGLPAHPADLLARGKLVTHSVRSWHDLTEQQIRDFFAAARA
jgi:hypothetical protein